MSAPSRDEAGARDPEEVAILATRGRDGEIIAALLREDGLRAAIYPDLDSLPAAIATSGAVVVTAEKLASADVGPLSRALEAQPAWSDFPVIVLTLRGGGEERNPAALRQMQALGNVSFLERPFHPMTFVSLIRTALASRRRQYQARDQLRALETGRAELARSDERLRFALEAGRLGAWEIELDGMVLRPSARFKQNYGRSPEADFTYDEMRRAIHPDDLARRDAAVEAAIARRGDYEVAYRIRTPAGETRWIEIRGRASRPDEGPALMAGVSLDITDRKHAEERQHLLIRELHHRVKNTLSTVQALVGSTARGATTIDDFYRDFSGRIMSLANTHSILTEELWQRASLRELLGKELDLYDTVDSRVWVDGPDVELPSDFAVPLGMAFHELTTNAAKYGALSNGHGRVSVAWRVEPGQDTPRVRLDWVEEGGPAVEEPKHHGFGTRLLRRVLTAQMKADVQINYDAAGLRVSMDFALPEDRNGAPSPGWSSR